jgi:imidazoleglycerol-phosphate dehydratase / histidinol-phosphatase
MYKVVIDKIFLEPDNRSSKGLITGLKKLAENDFEIEVPGFKPKENNFASKIFELEDIPVNKNGKKNYKKTFKITDKKDSDKNSITIKQKTKINSFEKAVNYILTRLRSSEQYRKTKETEIKIEAYLDGSGEAKINTGIGFFDHMLEQIAKHANINLNIAVNGDLHVDEHHTVEDVGITLGTAINEALGGKKGIKRYGYFLPMDDAIARCAVDLGGRTYLNFKVKFEREKVGGFPTELTEEFFRGLASGMKANIYIRAKAKNDHHKIEAIFKAFAKALNEACRLDERNKGRLPSTKGVL